MTRSTHLRRSLLYVPGDKEAMLAKAPGRGADGLILNLEDAVAPNTKDVARDTVARALHTVNFGACEVIVRINPPDTDAGYRDLLAIVPAGPDALLLPKVGAPEAVRFAAWTVTRLESLAGLPPGRVQLMCMIESAAGVLAAAAIAGADPRVAALIFGANDLGEDLRCPADSLTIGHGAGQVVLAARAAGVDAIDTPHMVLDDPAGVARSAQASLAAGFDGKSAIHPAQIAAINAAFAPTAEQIAWAHRVCALAPDGDARGLGAAVLDGQLIEAPHLNRARRILAADAARAVTP